MFSYYFQKFQEYRQKELEHEEKLGRPSWKHRRRLIFGSYYLGVGMIVFAAVTLFFDTQVGVELVVGGVALITIITSVYVGGATIEDVNLWRRREVKEEYSEDYPDGEFNDGI